MFQRLLFSILLTVTCLAVQGQECSPSVLTNGTYLEANYISALIPASGNLFWDTNDAQFNIQGPDGGFATIFAHGLWITALEEDGDAAVAIATYGASSGNSDYYPGPVNTDGTTDPGTCSNYDRVWSVFRYQIEAHLADFQNNGTIDTPQAAVMGWPGRGNAQFASINGFELPGTSEELAPFVDTNGDGIYQPLAGEYPYVPQSETTPDQIIWSVFNTVGGEPNESGSPVALQMEIQLLAWAFNCTDNLDLSNSLFTSFKLINRSDQVYQEMRLGLWADFDLGCYEDDYVGSAPDLNTFFVYNETNMDGACEQNINSAGENPPVQAITILNQPLAGFMYSYNNSVGGGSPLPDGTGAVSDYLNYMNNRFVDGTPLTQGGTGYDPMSTAFVNFAFPDDPNDPDGWSEYTTTFLPQDRRALGNIAGPATLAAGGIYVLDVLYSYHRAPGADHLGNVTAMYAGVAALQEDYNNAFTSACSQLVVCEDDCIWSGDLNADGIANHEDLIALGFDMEATGTDRGIPYSWTPENGDSWGMNQLNGADTKHLDANGDGQANLEDIDQTIHHYNFTRPDYVANFEYPVGDDLTFTRLTGGGFENLSPGEFFSAQARLETDVADLRALAFTLEYDPLYFASVNSTPSGLNGADMKLIDSRTPGALDYAYYLLDTDAEIDPGSQLLVLLRMLDLPEELLESDETFVRFRNIRGYLSDGTEVDLGAREIRFQINGIAVSTEEPIWAEGIRLFPNPVTDRLNWTFGNVSPTDYRLLDMQGRTLQSGPVMASGLDLRALPAGIYSLQLMHAKTTVVRKVVKH